MQIKRAFGAFAALAVLAIAFLTLVDAARAASVTPELLEGSANRTCAQLQGDGQTWIEFKVDPPANGTFSDGTLTVTITNLTNTKTFDWSSNIGVDAVFVKAGAGGSYLYRYDLPDSPNTEVTSDTGLTSPGAGTTNQISHISFCYDIESRIIVDKVTNPSGSAQSFNFTTTGTGYTGFSLTDTATPDNQELAPGSYSVTEVVPSGWDLTDLRCTDPDSGTTVNLGTKTATIDLDRGETVTCTFTNTQRGTIIVEKQTVPDGASGSFTFSGDAAGSISDGQQITVANLVPGTYTSTETVPSGWDLTSISCNDANSTGNLGTQTATFRLEAGETVKCTFTNTQRATIIVKKVMIGGTGSFTYTGTPSGAIATNNGTISAIVAPGQYTSTETVPAGWDLNSITCDDANSSGNVGTATATFNAEAGETVTCTFTNTKRGRIIVDKVTNPSGSTQSFSFQASGGSYASFNLTDGAPPNSQPLVPGSYSVTEINLPAGWELSGLSCTDPDNGTTTNLATRTATIDLDAGEDVTCVFTNVQTLEGCTPGYWKNHTGSWLPTGYSTGQRTDSVFSGASAFPSLASQTLLQSLDGGGGPGTLGAAKILLRAAVAALLNAAHPGVDYPRTPSQIIADVNAALSSNNRQTMLNLASGLDRDNNLGCPLN